MSTLSIITPAYNRASLLERCYRSLLAQTNFQFEWILVDDGSTDNTAEIAASFRPEIFSFRYIWKPNGGKHTALNTAMQYLHGDYVLILDSDDYLTETAVEETLSAWERYEKDESIGMVVFLKGNADGQPVCTVADFEKPVEILRYRRQKLSSSDCCEVIRSELFRKYPFPVFEGERFLSECALWNRVSFTHKCVYINSVIYICEYLEGGMTKQGRRLRIRNPRGGMYISNLRMDRSNFFSQRVKYTLLYDCYGFFAGFNAKTILKKEKEYGLLKALCLIPGFFLYVYWKHRYLA